MQFDKVTKTMIIGFVSVLCTVMLSYALGQEHIRDNAQNMLHHEEKHTIRQTQYDKDMVELKKALGEINGKL